MKFEEEHLDLLRNIEFGIVREFRRDPSLLDVDARDAIAALVRHYQAEEEQRTVPAARLADRAQGVFDSVRMICEWRLGRPSEMAALRVGAATHPELVACLRRVQRSIDFWNKRGGRRSYLSFVVQYLP